MRSIFKFLIILLAFRVDAAPTWHGVIPSKTWGTLPNSKLGSSGVLEAGGKEVMDAWGGGILIKDSLYIGATKTYGTFQVVFGGGHTDYGGNEVYAYGPLENSTPQWYRLRDSTTPAPTNINYDVLGNPVSRHVYNSISYVNDGTRNAMYCMGILYRYFDAGGGKILHRFNFNQITPNSIQPWDSLATLDSNATVVSVYDPKLNRIWYQPNAYNAVAYYDVSANTHSVATFKSPLGYGENAMSALDTSRGIWMLWDPKYGLSAYHTNAGTTNDFYRPSVTGYLPHCNSANPCDSLNNGTILYDNLRDRFICRFQRDSSFARLGNTKAFWELIPPATSPYQGGNAWTWKKITPSGGTTPISSDTNGTFGRFEMVNKSGMVGYLYTPSTSDSMFFYNSDTTQTSTWGPFGNNDMFMLKVGL